MTHEMEEEVEIALMWKEKDSKVSQAGAFLDILGPGGHSPI